MIHYFCHQTHTWIIELRPKKQHMRNNLTFAALQIHTTRDKRYQKHTNWKNTRYKQMRIHTNRAKKIQIHTKRVKKYKKQAGLSGPHSRIALSFPLIFPFTTHKSQSIQWLLIYSTFNILIVSFIGGCLHFEDLKNLVWSFKFKFKI